MNPIVIEIGGKELTFSVKFEVDYDSGEPWNNSDGHGPVSEWTSRDKLPGERVLNKDRSLYRYYDVAEATRIAKRDSWGLCELAKEELAEKLGHAPTKGEIVAEAVNRDFEYLRSWCNDEWNYVGVVVTLLDDEGDETEVSDSVWGVEDRNDYAEEIARQLADELAHGYGTRWDVVEKQSFGYIK